MPPWRLIESGPAPGPWNLALDDAIFAAVRDGASPPTLRLYAWDPPALSIGFAQDPQRDVDLEACRARGVAVLRRVTGGRAVLHDREVTYSVAAPVGPAPFGGTLDEAFGAIAEALLRALSHLGVPGARRAPAHRGGERRVRPAGCFAAAVRHEIEVGGRKLVGSAQRREGGAFLQHGSILLAGHGAALAGLLRDGGGEGNAMAGIEDLAGPRGRETVAAAVARGAAEAWGVAFASAGPSARELEAAARIERERYCCPAWNGGARGRPAGLGSR